MIGELSLRYAVMACVSFMEKFLKSLTKLKSVGFYRHYSKYKITENSLPFKGFFDCTLGFESRGVIS